MFSTSSRYLNANFPSPKLCLYSTICSSLLFSPSFALNLIPCYIPLVTSPYAISFISTILNLTFSANYFPKLKKKKGNFPPTKNNSCIFHLQKTSQLSRESTLHFPSLFHLFPSYIVHPLYINFSTIHNVTDHRVVIEIKCVHLNTVYFCFTLSRIICNIKHAIFQCFVIYMIMVGGDIEKIYYSHI